MSAVDQLAEVHRLRAEHGYGARRIAEQLGITRHAATLLLSQSTAVAEDDREERQPVAEPVAEVAASQVQPPAVVAATDGQERRPVAEVRLPRRVSAERLEIDLRRRPALRRDLAVLAATGMDHEELIDFAVRVLAMGYKQGLEDGVIVPGLFQVRGMKVSPYASGPVVPRRPTAPPAPAEGA